LSVRRGTVRADSREIAADAKLRPMSPVLVAWGELCWDLFPDGPRLGGAAANVAVHAATLGARSLLVSRVGDDELGQRALRQLAARGVETRFVQIDPEQPTGTVQVDVSDGEPRYTIGAQAAWDAIALEPALALELAHTDAFVHGTLAQRTPLGGAELARALDAVGPLCRKIVDLNVRPPHVGEEAIRRAVSRADVVKLNEHEARLVAEIGEGRDPIAFLLEAGARLVALTRGRAGAELHSASDHRVHPGFANTERGGDSVGAGDAFSAALAVELCRGTPLDDVLVRANRYAGFVASMPGAMPEPSAELEREVRQWRR
jgi:fructokinase